jgi:hypothetical protein
MRECAKIKLNLLFITYYDHGEWLVIKMDISNLLRTMLYWNNFHQVCPRSKDWNLNKIKIFGTKKTNVSK